MDGWIGGQANVQTDRWILKDILQFGERLQKMLDLSVADVVLFVMFVFNLKFV